MSPFSLAVRHLWRKKLSTSIALIGIAMSVATSGVLLRVFLLSKSRFSSLARTGDAIVGAKSSGLNLLLGCLNLEGDYPDFVPGVLYQSLAGRQSVHFEDGATVDNSPVDTTIPFVVFAQVQNFRVLGTNNLFTQAAYPTLPKFKEGQFPTGQNEVILGSDVAERMNSHVGDSLHGQTWVDKNHQFTEGITFKVVGILSPTEKAWDRGVYSNLETAQAVFAFHQNDLKSIWKNNLLHYYLIYLRPENTGVGMNWLKTLINQRTVAQTVAVDEEIHQLEELTGTQQDLGIFISLIIIFLGALSTSTMMITRFESMGQQLAILRAVGYSRKELRRLLLVEAALLGLIAVSIGALLDALVFPWVRSLLGDSLPSTEIINLGLWNSYPIWIMALLGSLLSILIPLWRIQQQDIHSSLRDIS